MIEVVFAVVVLALVVVTGWAACWGMDHFEGDDE